MTRSNGCWATSPDSEWCMPEALVASRGTSHLGPHACRIQRACSLHRVTLPRCISSLPTGLRQSPLSGSQIVCLLLGCDLLCLLLACCPLCLLLACLVPPSWLPCLLPPCCLSACCPLCDGSLLTVISLRNVQTLHQAATSVPIWNSIARLCHPWGLHQYRSRRPHPLRSHAGAESPDKRHRCRPDDSRWPDLPSVPDVLRRQRHRTPACGTS